MPYIEQENRPPIDKLLEPLANEIKFQGKKTPISSLGQLGPLNYAITRLLILTCPSKRYASFVLVIGTLFMVAFEFYRRVIARYEDKKIQENGDVGYDEIK